MRDKYALFAHMADAHNLTLLDSELEEIQIICREMEPDPPYGIYALYFLSCGFLLGVIVSSWVCLLNG